MYDKLIATLSVPWLLTVITGIINLPKSYESLFATGYIICFFLFSAVMYAVFKDTQYSIKQRKVTILLIYVIGFVICLATILFFESELIVDFDQYANTEKSNNYKHPCDDIEGYCH
jgi:Na+/proline symporter